MGTLKMFLYLSNRIFTLYLKTHTITITTTVELLLVWNASIIIILLLMS